MGSAVWQSCRHRAVQRPDGRSSPEEGVFPQHLLAIRAKRERMRTNGVGFLLTLGW